MALQINAFFRLRNITSASEVKSSVGGAATLKENEGHNYYSHHSGEVCQSCGTSKKNQTAPPLRACRFQPSAASNKTEEVFNSQLTGNPSAAAVLNRFLPDLSEPR